MTKFETLHGRVMMTRGDIAKELGISPLTVDARTKELQEEIRQGRYDERVITKTGGIKIINYLAFLDFLHYRDRLMEKNLRKSVPPFDPVYWSQSMGYYKEVDKAI